MTLPIALVFACLWMGQGDCNTLTSAGVTLVQSGPYPAWTDTASHHVFLRQDQQATWPQLLVHETQHVKNLNDHTFTCVKSEQDAFHAEADFVTWAYGSPPWWVPYIDQLAEEMCH